MAPPAQQPVSSPNEPQPYVHNGWRQVVHGQWTRETTGGETGISYNQNVRDGHTELTTSLTFSTSLSTTELIQRVRNAWLVCHASHPEVAIQLSTGTEIPQIMTFDTLQSEADAEAWLQETLHVVTDQQAPDVARMTYSRRLPTKGKRSMLYLVTAGAAYPEYPNRHCFVWNFGHTMADAYSVVLFNNYLLRTLTQVPGDRNLAVSELDYSGLASRLPVTPITPYEQEHQPTREQREEAIAGAISQAELYSSKVLNPDHFNQQLKLMETSYVDGQVDSNVPRTGRCLACPRHLLHQTSIRGRRIQSPPHGPSRTKTQHHIRRRSGHGARHKADVRQGP